jgi:hypothetical protein
MKERLPFSLPNSFELVGTNVSQSGVLVTTEYYFRGWIPIENFPPGTRPLYTHGYTGLETKVTIESIEPVATVKVVDRLKKVS